MSEIFVDTIRKTGGTLGTDIRIKNTSVYESDGGTSVTQNLVQGVLKGWCNFTMVSSTAYRDSFNSGTLTDNGTGSATVNLTNPFSNDDWAGSMYTNTYGTETTYSNHFAGGFDNRTSSSVRVATNNGTSSVDAALNDVLFAGDLA